MLPEKIAVWSPAWNAVVEPFHQLAVTIVVGFEEDAAQAQNVALTFRPNSARDRYAKQHLIAGLEPLVPGHEAGTLGNGESVAICKDLDFPATVRHDAHAGSTTIAFVPAWDFVRDSDTHAALAIFRGVENGFAVVRSARQGVMTVSDAQGRLIARAMSNPGGPALLIASVSPGPGPTIYNRIGDCFAWLCALTSLVMFAAIARAGERCLGPNPAELLKNFDNAVDDLIHSAQRGIDRYDRREADRREYRNLIGAQMLEIVRHVGARFDEQRRKMLVQQIAQPFILRHGLEERP